MHNLILLMVVILNNCFVFVEGEPDIILTTTVELTEEETATLLSTLHASFEKFEKATRSLTDEVAAVLMWKEIYTTSVLN